MSTIKSMHKTNSDFVHLYDTTLRDGSQRKGLSFSLEDKLKITKLLDGFGVSYIEGGWPGSNPKDMEYFRRARQLGLQHSKLVAFGSTCRVGTKPENDTNLRAVIDAQTPVVTIVGKSSVFHIEKVLETTLTENLRLIRESVRFLKKHRREVMFDAEHFFDGYAVNAQYALTCLQTAVDAGADWVVLCDTNGGSLPQYVQKVVSNVVKAGMSAEAVVKVRIGKTVYHTAAEGCGPVDALDQALRKALHAVYPETTHVRLADYKVRILDPDAATGATTRVTIEATAGDETWCTVGCSPNIIDASYKALADTLELYLLRRQDCRKEVVA